MHLSQHHAGLPTIPCISSSIINATMNLHAMQIPMNNNLSSTMHVPKVDMVLLIYQDVFS